MVPTRAEILELIRAVNELYESAELIGWNIEASDAIKERLTEAFKPLGVTPTWKWDDPLLGEREFGEVIGETPESRAWLDGEPTAAPPTPPDTPHSS